MNKWEETVMSDEQRCDVLLEATKHKLFDGGMAIAEAQAKLTWEARQKEVDEARDKGYQEAVEKMSYTLPGKFRKAMDEAEQRGVKKVTDWLKKNALPSEIGNIYYIVKPTLQAFLKGVEK